MDPHASFVREASYALNEKLESQITLASFSPRRERPRSESSKLYNPWENEDFALRQLAWQAKRAPRQPFHTSQIRKSRRPTSLPDHNSKNNNRKTKTKYAWPSKSPDKAPAATATAPPQPLLEPRPPSTPKPASPAAPSPAAASVKHGETLASRGKSAARDGRKARPPLALIAESPRGGGDGLIQYDDVRHVIEDIQHSALAHFEQDVSLPYYEYVHQAVASIQRSAIDLFSKELARCVDDNSENTGRANDATNPINSRAVIHKRK